MVTLSDSPAFADILDRLHKAERDLLAEREQVTYLEGQLAHKQEQLDEATKVGQEWRTTAIGMSAIVLATSMELAGLQGTIRKAVDSIQL